jgi:signal transduction histidine kinase
MTSSVDLFALGAPGAAELIAALDIAVFRYRDGRLTPGAAFPSWFARFSSGARDDGSWDFGGPHSFLDHFLEEARPLWDAAADGHLTSGPWTQPARDGADLGLRALAIRHHGVNLLAIEPLGVSFEASRTAMQEAHELGLLTERLERQREILTADNERLSAAREEIQRLHDLKRDFLASLSHELKTPLNAIVGFSTLLSQQKAGPLTAKQSGYVDQVLSAARHLTEMINDVLDLSHLESGHLPLQVSRFRLADVLAEAYTLAESAANAKGVTLTPPPETGAELNADRLRIRQVLSNLLGNAIKFTPAGGTVSTEVQTHPGGHTIAIVDNGMGIPESERDVIFERFRRGSNASGTKGAGLGLAIAKGLLDLHHGTIRAVPNLGSGSRFEIFVPFSSGIAR